MFTFFSEVTANSTEEIVRFVGYNKRVFGGILSTFTVKGASRLGLLGNTDRPIFQVSRAYFFFLANSV